MESCCESVSPKPYGRLGRLVAVICMALSLITAALADGSVTLTFPDASTKYAWVQDGYPSQIPADAVPVRSAQVQLAVPPKTPAARVFVLDKLNGVVAERKISDLKDASWDVKPTDFNEIAEVTVKVGYGGKPVAAASVNLKDSQRTQTQILDSSSNGAIKFDCVMRGKADVSVSYRSQGAMAPAVTQTFDLTAPKDVSPTLDVAVPGPVDTVGGGTTTAVPVTTGGPVPGPSGSIANPVSPTQVPVSTSPVGSFIVVVVVLVCILALGYTFFMWAKKNPDKAKATFEQIGIQIPKPQDDAMNAGMPNVPIQPVAAPQPVQKIMLGDSSPDPLMGAAPASQIAVTPYSGSAVAASPQLRSSSGDVIPISDAPMVVGRDVGLGLSLVGESTVSRRHAEIHKTPDGLLVKDLGSTNGTFVNGSKVQGEANVKPGDQVQFGAIQFRYEG